jgi:hydrogenase-4 component F
MIILSLIAVPILAAMVTGVIPRSQQRSIEVIAIVTAFFEAVVALILAQSVASGVDVSSSSVFIPDALGAFVVAITAVVGFAAAMQSVGHLRVEKNKGVIGFTRLRQYFVLFHLFFMAMYVAALTTSPLLTWIAIEATTLATAFLTTFYNKDSSLEAGWKQLILNSIGL